jgi:hypothetical protein
LTTEDVGLNEYHDTTKVYEAPCPALEVFVVRPHFLSLTFAMCAALSVQADERRQLGAHVHGHARLNVAIEGKALSLELEAPGMDIVGFEHEPGTAEQKAALADAKTKLADGLKLFAPSTEASCALKSANISAEAEQEDEHEHEAKSEGKEEHHHSEFRVEYAFECASPDRLTLMTFGYFKEFPNSLQLDVSVISPNGQSSSEVSRDKPSLNLTGAL